MRSKMLSFATAIATVYAIYLITYFSGNTLNAENSAEAAGGAIATALVMPHMIMFIIGAVFGWIGVLAKKNWAALLAAILYSVGTVLFPLYFMFGIPILILGFIGYALQKKLNKQSI